jgi:acetyltransferase-like isoleucine patch superfamily enzyme
VKPLARAWLQRAAVRFDALQRELLEVRPGDPVARRFAAFGSGSWIQAPYVHLGNVESVAIGDNVEIRSYVCLEALAPPGQVVITIGSRIVVGHFVRLVAVNGIDIADDCGIGHGVTLGDTLHAWEEAGSDGVPWQTPLKLGGPLRVESGAWIGNNSVVTGGITIGARAIIAPNSVVTRDVPAETLVSGNPARRVPFPRE